MERKIACPIWGTDSIESTDESWVKAGTSEPIVTEQSLIISERAGGEYRIKSLANVLLNSGRLAGTPTDGQKARLTTWLVDQRRHGIAAPIVTLDLVE